MNLTTTQLRAAQSTDRSVAVIAGAGSGKTHVVIERCRILLDEGNGLDRLLVLTFTEKAAAELTARLKPLLKPQLLAKLLGAWIGTFHACCTRILRAHAPLAGIDPSFHILDEHAGRLLAREATERSLLQLLKTNDPSAVLLIEEMGFRNARGLLAELMDFRWHARQLTIPDEPHDDRALIPAVIRCFQVAEETLRQDMERRSALDFQALEIEAIRLLEAHPEIRQTYQKRFRHLLIDECQDTNDIQATFISLLHNPAINRLFVVGDPRQSIYRFRGANVQRFFSLIDLIRNHGGDVLPLAENFRSRPGILSFVNRLEVLDDTSVALVAMREASANPNVTVLACGASDDRRVAALRSLEAEAIAAHIRSLADKGEMPYGDVVCLFQALTATDIYEQTFRRWGIPFRVVGGGYLLDRPEITDLISVLTYASNPRSDSALIALLRSPLIGLSDDDLVIMAGSDGKQLRFNARRHTEAGPLLEMLASGARHRRPSEILRLLLDETAYEIFSSMVDASGGRAANIDRFISMIETLESEAPVTLRSLVNYLKDLRFHGARLGETPVSADATNAVRLMTVHAAKGLQFPVVILPDLIRRPVAQKGAWCFVRGKGLGIKHSEELLKYSLEEDERESRRLLYVALTRAREKLIIPLHNGDDVKGRWHQWLKPLVDHDVAVVQSVDTLPLAAEARPAMVIPEVFSIAPGEHPQHEGRMFTVSQLEAFSRCPHEHYLKHHLGLPAETLFPRREDVLPAHVRGSILHAVLEEIDPRNPDAIPHLLRRQCLLQNVDPEDAVMAALSQPLLAFRESEFFKALDTGCREVPFHWKLKGHIIHGKVDWIKPSPGGIDIVDFKTDRVEGEALHERAKSYDLQMVAYALAIEEALATPVRATTLYFLDAGSPVTVLFDDARRAMGRERLSMIMDRINANDFTLRDYIPPCAKPDTTCPYHLNHLCWLDWQKKNRR